ncbi:MAG: hypothetical protein OQL09_00150 [Gammaproteobacteria bacterium]|nr:hypothetical protein [Gammaproteobacteria bacterium]
MKTIIAACLLALLPLTQIAHAGDYLSELEAEADTISDNNISSQKTQPTEDLKLSELQIAQLEEFEATLQRELPSTYKLYIRLPPGKRLIIVENYFLNNKQMTSATKQLFNLYFENK